VNLSTDGGATYKFTFTVTPMATIPARQRRAPTCGVSRGGHACRQDGRRSPPVKVETGQDVEANLDMSRQAYIDKMPAEQKKELEDMKKANAAALQ